MQSKLSSILLCAFLASGATASETTPRETCHRLMTASECGEHRHQLATLAPGEALDRYLAEHDRTRKEREAACDCTRGPSAGRIHAPLRQARMTL